MAHITNRKAHAIFNMLAKKLGWKDKVVLVPYGNVDGVPFYTLQVEDSRLCPCLYQGKGKKVEFIRGTSWVNALENMIKFKAEYARDSNSMNVIAVPSTIEEFLIMLDIG